MRLASRSGSSVPRQWLVTVFPELCITLSSRSLIYGRGRKLPHYGSKGGIITVQGCDARGSKRGPMEADGMETLLVWKKQLLEDMTNKQVLGHRWKRVEQEQREFAMVGGARMVPLLQGRQHRGEY